MTSVLIVFTSHEQLGSTGKPTGWFLSEAAHPWKVFTEMGYGMTFMSPKGGKPQMDGVDLDDPIQAEFLAEFGDAGPHTVVPERVNAVQFEAIFYVGGHGTMWDVPHHPVIAELAAAIYQANGVVAAVCHGPAGLLPIELPDGTKLIDGKDVAGFTNSEEAAVGLTDVVPFLLEDELNKAGANHQAGPDFEPKIVVDGRLVTGQNPASATAVAESVVVAITRANAT
jgi:putative intracellular protease/amidase